MRPVVQCLVEEWIRHSNDHCWSECRQWIEVEVERKVKVAIEMEMEVGTRQNKNGNGCGSEREI